VAKSKPSLVNPTLPGSVAGVAVNPPVPMTSITQEQIGKFNKGRLDSTGSDRKLVGVKNIRITIKSEDDLTGIDIGGSILGVDDNTRADSARILFQNLTGDTVDVYEFGLIGTPIYEITGREGWIHDDFVDYEDIKKNGEKEFILSNRYVMDKDQVEDLADFFWKWNRQKPHFYSLSFPGTLFYFEPGERYTIVVGGAGESENINSVVDCYRISTTRPQKALGKTTVTFRELYQNWTKTSNAAARLIASGAAQRFFNRGNVITVAPSDYVGSANVYCDGTNDGADIEEAMTFLSNAYNGGTVHLLKGTFNVSLAISPGNNNIILEGEGDETIIQFDGNLASEFLRFIDISNNNNNVVRDLKIQQINRTNENGIGINCASTQRAMIQNVTIDGFSNY
jgi:hypothetical protein